MFSENGFLPCPTCGIRCQTQFLEGKLQILCASAKCAIKNSEALLVPEKPTFKRLYATMYNGKPVGIYESNRARLLVRYENPSVDSPDNLRDSAFSHDNGSHGQIEVLSEYIRKLILKIEPYETIKL